MIRKLPEDIAEFFQGTGRLGEEIGGKRSLETMTPEERSERAQKAAAASAEAQRKGATTPLPAVVRSLEASRSPTACRSAALILAGQLLNLNIVKGSLHPRARKSTLAAKVEVI